MEYDLIALKVSMAVFYMTFIVQGRMMTDNKDCSFDTTTMNFTSEVKCETYLNNLLEQPTNWFTV